MSFGQSVDQDDQMNPHIMTALSERYVRLAIKNLKQDIENLNGFVELGNEISRQNEYKIWLADLEAYYKENHGDILVNEEKAHEEFIASLASRTGLRF